MPALTNDAATTGAATANTTPEPAYNEAEYNNDHPFNQINYAEAFRQSANPPAEDDPATDPEGDEADEDDGEDLEPDTDDTEGDGEDTAEEQGDEDEGEPLEAETDPDLEGLDLKRANRRTQERIRTLANERRAAQQELEPWRDLIAEFRQQGYENAAALRDAIERQNIEAQQRQLAAALQAQVDNGEIDEYTARILFENETTKAELARMQAKLAAEQARVAEEAKKNRIASVAEKYPVLKERNASPLLQMFVNAGQDPEEAAAALAAFIGTDKGTESAKRQNEAVRQIKDKKKAPPVAGGRDKNPAAGVVPADRVDRNARPDQLGSYLSLMGIRNKGTI